MSQGLGMEHDCNQSIHEIGNLFFLDFFSLHNNMSQGLGMEHDCNPSIHEIKSAWSL